MYKTLTLLCSMEYVWTISKFFQMFHLKIIFQQTMYLIFSKGLFHKIIMVLLVYLHQSQYIVFIY